MVTNHLSFPTASYRSQLFCNESRGFLTPEDHSNGQTTKQIKMMRLTSSLCTVPADAPKSNRSPKRSPNRSPTINSHHSRCSAMQLLFILIILTVGVQGAYHPDINIQQPPSIFKGPGYEQLFQVLRDQSSDRSDKPFSLECEATGNPEPKYYWKKNGLDFDYVAYDKRISQQPKRGTLVFGKPESIDVRRESNSNIRKFRIETHPLKPTSNPLLLSAKQEGLYQCFARNDHGTSLSNSVFLRKAELNSFSNTQTERIDVEEGQPLSIE